jgi:hypothetical protein
MQPVFEILGKKYGVYLKLVKKMEFKIKHLFIVNIITAAVFGLGFLFMTETQTTMLGITDNQLGFKFFGLALFGNCITLFFARNSGDNEARTAILLYNSVGGGLLVILMLVTLDLTNVMVWFTIILQVVLSGLHGYFIVKKE